MDKKDVPVSQPASGGSIDPGQASRSITAERRRAMAEEKVRMLGRRRTLPSALEVAADQWDRGQETRKRAEQGRLSASRQAQMPPFSLQRVALRAGDPSPADEAFWKVYIPPQSQRKRVPRRGRIAGFPVGAFATRLIQKERAGGGRIAIHLRDQALEEAACRWEERRKAGRPTSGGCQ